MVSGTTRSGLATNEPEQLIPDGAHGSYYPPTPIHQPLSALFQSAPSVARALIRDLSNRATTGWRQIVEINAPQHGTPLPLDLEFPWGSQRFWGDTQTYASFEGHGTLPQTLEAAFLALTYWAHKSLDEGRELDSLIKDVVEGHESWTVLGLACTLALQRCEATETVLPLVTDQRLWNADLQRQVQESSGDIFLFGLNPRNQMTRDQRDAFDYLKTRRFKTSSIRELTYAFALNGNEALRSKFKLALEAFPENLPFNYEEEKADEAYAKRLSVTAQVWSKWGDTGNYTIEEVPDQPDTALVRYNDPDPISEDLEHKRQASAKALRDYDVINWVRISFDKGVPDPRWTLRGVLEFARSRDVEALFAVLDDTGAATQACVAAAATAATQLGADPGNIAWAWSVMDRIGPMTDHKGPFRHSPHPMDPRLYLIGSLAHDLRGKAPRPDSATRLITLATDTNPNIANAALTLIHPLIFCLPFSIAYGSIQIFTTVLSSVRTLSTPGFHSTSMSLEAPHKSWRADGKLLWRGPESKMRGVMRL